MTAKMFRLPDLGEGLTEATLMRWLVAVGDTIAVDQPIAEVETAKSVVEVPSPFAGTVGVLHGAEGELLLVGAPFVEVAEPDDESDALGFARRRGRGVPRRGAGRLGQRAHRLRDEGGARRRSHAPSARCSRRRHGDGAATPATATRESGPVAVRSPIVRRLAHDRGVDLHAVTPTGPDGIVTREDVIRATAPVGRGRRHPKRAVEHAAPGGRRQDVAQPHRDPRGDGLGGRRRDRALDRASRRWPTPATSTAPPSLTAMLARFVIAALARYPVLATRLSADGSSLEYLDGIHLGIATDSDRGLLVPVIRHAEAMSIGQLDDELRSLAEAARSGRIPPDQLTGSTFTLNNYGTFGVDGGSPIINYPEVAILGVGRMIERPWVVEGQIVPRRIAQVSLVFDHRVCDGGYATGFLRAVVDAMEHPMRLYREL